MHRRYLIVSPRTATRDMKRDRDVQSVCAIPPCTASVRGSDQNVMMASTAAVSWSSALPPSNGRPVGPASPSYQS